MKIVIFLWLCAIPAVTQGETVYKPGRRENS